MDERIATRPGESHTPSPPLPSGGLGQVRVPLPQARVLDQVDQARRRKENPCEFSLVPGLGDGFDEPEFHQGHESAQDLLTALRNVKEGEDAVAAGDLLGNRVLGHPAEDPGDHPVDPEGQDRGPDPDPHGPTVLTISLQVLQADLFGVQIPLLVGLHDLQNGLQADPDPGSGLEREPEQADGRLFQLALAQGVRGRVRGQVELGGHALDFEPFGLVRAPSTVLQHQVLDRHDALSFPTKKTGQTGTACRLCGSRQKKKIVSPKLGEPGS